MGTRGEKAQADLTKLKSGKPLKVNHLKPEVSNAQTIALDIKAKAAEQEWRDKGEEKLDARFKKVGKIKKPAMQTSARPRGSGDWVCDDETDVR